MQMYLEVLQTKYSNLADRVAESFKSVTDQLLFKEERQNQLQRSHNALKNSCSLIQ